jgi:hypothetical protein
MKGEIKLWNATDVIPRGWKRIILAYGVPFLKITQIDGTEKEIDLIEKIK